MGISEYKIFFKIKSEILYGVSIRAVQNKIELFYHYPFGSRTNAEMENMENGRIDNGYLPDHISFHNDGKIHSKARNEKRKILYFNELIPGLNIFNLERTHYLPFFIESLNISEARFIDKRFIGSITFNPIRDIMYDLSSYNSFSIVLISKCEKVNPKYILQSEPLNKLKIISVDIISGIFTKEDKMKNFEKHSNFNTDLMILIVENVWDKFPIITHHINDDEGITFNTTVCMPPSELLEKMINLN